MMKKLLRELEEMVVDAWPAEQTFELDGWLLRASGGPSHRGNSVSTLGVDGALEDEQRIAQAEAWYVERGAAPQFQVGPCVQPKELDAQLASRGYEKRAETLLCVATPEDVVQRGAAVANSTRLESKPSSTWLELAVGQSRFASTRAGFSGFLRRLGTRCRFASVGSDARFDSACLLIASEERWGIYAMITRPEARRRGQARSLLHGVAQQALQEGVRELYLMVELQNEAGRALYDGAGFRELYRYHYRTRAPS